MSLAPGQTIDRYVVERRIGRGGMAEVFAVRHRPLGTRHALKVLLDASEDLRERLLREGRVQASLDHPNVVPVRDVFDVEGAPALGFTDLPAVRVQVQAYLGRAAWLLGDEASARANAEAARAEACALASRPGCVELFELRWLERALGRGEGPARI